jgi:predicted tellurium resistance membrane protein TerC
VDFALIFNTLISLLTLTCLEIVLGVDNLIFISIASSRLPKHQQKLARRLGLFFALITRLLLLASVVWIVGLTKPWFHVTDFAFSGRDVFMILGGVFLLYKGTIEIHAEFEAYSQPAHMRKLSKFVFVVTQIAIFDIVFSLDSILTAIGLTQNFMIMATAIVIAVIVMMIGSEPLSRFVNAYPTVRLLALSFLLLIGTVLIADGFQFHVPRGYIYFAVCFSVFVEILNSKLKQKKKGSEEVSG